MRRFQFNLRTIALAITVLAVILAWLSWQYREAKVRVDALEILRNDGANVEWSKDARGFQPWIRSMLVGPLARKSVDAVWFTSDGLASKAACHQLVNLPEVERFWAPRLESVDCIAAIAKATHLREFRSTLDQSLNDASMQTLSKLPQLESITVTSANVTDKGFAVIRSLPITTLQIPFTALSDRGMNDLYEMRNLRHLDVSYTKVTSEGLKRLKELAALEWLSIGELGLTDKSISTLDFPNNLRQLHLNGNPISDEGLRAIVPLKQLEILDLSFTEVDDAAIVPLSAFVTLKELDIRRTRITSEGANRLHDLCPSLKVKYNTTGASEP